MTKEIINNKIIEILKQIETIKNTGSIKEDTLLYDECGLDSASVIELIVLLEEEYNIELDAGLLKLQNFSTVNRISDIVVNCIESPKK